MSEPLLIRRCLSFLLVAVAMAVFGASVAHSDVPAAPGVIVLRNGNVLEGAVRRVGDHYLVEHQGATLQVAAEQVETACGSLVEAYELRRQDRVGASADPHLELAQWCLRQGLLDQAAREVLDARMLDPGHLTLAVMDLQIRQALEIEASRLQRAEQAIKEQATMANATLVPQSEIAARLNPSIEAQAQFVRSIQPMLINSCSTGGCHQTDSPQRMQLDRWALEGNGNPELIRRNLEAVLTQVNADDPPSSPVMVHARQSHGVRRDALSKPLATYQSALLLDWLNKAAGIEPEPTVEPVAPAAGGSLPTGAQTAAAHAPLPSETAASRTPAPYTPRDAFDPAIFNGQTPVRQEAADSDSAGTANEAAGAEELSAEAAATGRLSAEGQSAARQ